MMNFDQRKTKAFAIMLFLAHAVVVSGSASVIEDARKAVETGQSEKAVAMLDKAAAAGSAEAMYQLGMLYTQGVGEVDRDLDRSDFYLQSAADAGFGEALSYLGQRDESAAKAAAAKPEREKLFGKAREYYQRGVEAGNQDCRFYHARLLIDGFGGAQDVAAALRTYHELASDGNLRAMNELGIRYREGSWVDKNHATALGWFLIAAEKGSVASMTNLGLCYEKGVGVPVNPDRAGSWYSRASKTGYAPAQFLIGKMFEHGRGTKKNPVFAYVNYFRAAASGYADAKEARDAIKVSLNPEQLLEAESVLKSGGKGN
ncbi:tetratricopeptide repeat protein [Haloferula sp.]|uniref:tetratricopeptide repeat protein n=1 Tax=Haloferula sp. TaxID=2497595 RepID=UPI00329F039E